MPDLWRAGVGIIGAGHRRRWRDDPVTSFRGPEIRVEKGRPSGSPNSTRKTSRIRPLVRRHERFMSGGAKMFTPGAPEVSGILVTPKSARCTPIAAAETTHARRVRPRLRRGPAAGSLDVLNASSAWARCPLLERALRNPTDPRTLGSTHAYPSEMKNAVSATTGCASLPPDRRDTKTDHRELAGAILGQEHVDRKSEPVVRLTR